MIEAGDGEGENIRVVVRIRPMNLNEKKEGDFSCVESKFSKAKVTTELAALVMPWP